MTLHDHIFNIFLVSDWIPRDRIRLRHWWTHADILLSLIRNHRILNQEISAKSDLKDPPARCLTFKGPLYTLGHETNSP